MCSPSREALGLSLEGGVVTVVGVHPSRRCTSPLGVLPVGLGDGVGDCHDVANLPKGASFYFPCISFLGNKSYSFSESTAVVFLLPLGMLVAKWVPTPSNNDAYSVGTPRWALWGKGWLKHCKTMVSPFLGRSFL